MIPASVSVDEDLNKAAKEVMVSAVHLLSIISSLFMFIC